MSKGYFITGIGTEVGKTVVSAVLTEAWKADYWKPVQAGDLDHTDSMKVRSWVGNVKSHIHPEGFRLNTPASPHYSAQVDGVTIQVKDLQLPETDNTLVVEGAGGIQVPLNEEETMLDLMKSLGLPVILVSRNYLGSINHTLLSIEQLKRARLVLAGVLFTGEENPETERIILKQSAVNCIGRVPLLASINKGSISEAALAF